MPDGDALSADYVRVTKEHAVMAVHAALAAMDWDTLDPGSAALIAVEELDELGVLLLDGSGAESQAPGSDPDLPTEPPAPADDTDGSESA